MSQAFTKAMARNIFYGGSVFFFLLFLALTFDTHNAWETRDNRAAINASVSAGKPLWEENNCIGCHSLLGEGAYFAPELGNVFQRLGGKEGIKGFIKSRPKDGIPGRRSMPQFNFTPRSWMRSRSFSKYVVRDQYGQLAAEHPGLIGVLDHAIQVTSGRQAVFHRRHRPVRRPDPVRSDHRPAVRGRGLPVSRDPVQRGAHGAHQPADRLAAVRLHGRVLLPGAGGGRTRAAQPDAGAAHVLDLPGRRRADRRSAICWCPTRRWPR